MKRFTFRVLTICLSLFVLGLNSFPKLSSANAETRRKKQVETFKATYAEWDDVTGGGYLNVTISSSNQKSSALVYCRAEYEGVPVGSGNGFLSAGVGIIRIEMQQRFQNQNMKLKFHCVR